MIKTKKSESNSLKSNNYHKRTQVRKLVGSIIGNIPEVSIDSIDESGEISFSVCRRDIGITEPIYIKNKNVVLSNYFASIMGELMVRENIDMFSDFIVSLNPDVFSDLINKWSHKRFGICVKKDLIQFKFHASLLQSIIMENL